MPIEGYLSTSDPGRISTITNLPGSDITRRKKILPLTAGRIFAGERLNRTMYIRDCETHDPLGTVGGVILKRLKQGVGWEELGVAKCCLLCWRILIPPPGVDLPEPKPLPPVEGKVRAEREQRKAARKVPRTTKVSEVERGILRTYGFDVFSAQHVMEDFGVSRNGARQALLRLIEAGNVKVVSEGGGRGVRSEYALTEQGQSAAEAP